MDKCYGCCLVNENTKKIISLQLREKKDIATIYCFMTKPQGMITLNHCYHTNRQMVSAMVSNSLVKSYILMCLQIANLQWHVIDTFDFNNINIPLSLAKQIAMILCLNQFAN